MTSKKQLIEDIVKTWAQDHSNDYLIADMSPSRDAMEKTQGHLTWLIRDGQVNLNLFSLIEKLELVFNKKEDSKLDGMFCKKCQTFIKYAEPNQTDGLMICYSCRKNPYI